MKKIFLLLVTALLCNTLTVFSQVKIEDKSLRAQNNRAVYKQWGEFRPYPKYFLGIQTNINHTMVWGWLAPSKNKKYKNGNDIRPLKSNGTQNLRLAELAIYNNYLESMKKQTDKIASLAEDEFLNNNGLLTLADPLYLLYFKKVFSDLEDYNGYQNFLSKRKVSPSIISQYGTNGAGKAMDDNVSELKQILSDAKSVTMERGKRILLFHDILEQWRLFEVRMKNNLSMAEIYEKAKKAYKSNDKEYVPDFKGLSDEERMRTIIYSLK